MRVEILAAACPDWLGPALILDAEAGTVAFANMPCLSLSNAEEILIGLGGGLHFRSEGADEKFNRSLRSFCEGADLNKLLLLPWERKSRSLAVTFQRPAGFLRDLLVEAVDGSTDMIFVQFERRPYQHECSRFFVRVLSRMYDLSATEGVVVEQLVKNIDVGLQLSSASRDTARIPRQLLVKLKCGDAFEFIELIGDLYS